MAQLFFMGALIAANAVWVLGLGQAAYWYFF
ncbi:hypothetical protein BOSEA31B_10998 [Hyphomicrobiales bacterium]|nr:hypothetical protein BOSEA31B_10998 [Hyphomicrobiales bacterium]CAH1700848.1 hypothetical protein BOSEA1005_20547 [Hyphomicrobiales bacterium]CAI0344723.1 hypothetical protein BO1005MUT1_350090 [Hyphomicrobiales bacterium]